MRRWRLFPKYATLIVSLVAGLLLLSGGIGAYFSVRETEAHLSELQEEKAKAAAIRIEQFVLDIEHQMGWAALPVSFDGGNELEQRRITLIGVTSIQSVFCQRVGFGVDPTCTRVEFKFQ